MSYNRLKKYRYLKKENDDTQGGYFNFISITKVDYINLTDIEDIPIDFNITYHEKPGTSKMRKEEGNIDIESPVEYSNDSDDAIEIENIISSDELVENLDTFSSGTSSDELMPENKEDENKDLINGSIESKLKNWISRNTQTLTQKAIDEILVVLRSEGFTSLPKTSKTLLGTSTIRSELNIMESSDGTLGSFKYFGIQKNLHATVNTNIYNEDHIKLIIHVDGLDIFNKSKKGFWSILEKMYCNSYITKPFLIALYFGNSKPFSAREFLAEFV